MLSARLKPWLSERATAIAVVLFLFSLLLYTVAFLVEKGVQFLTPATVIAAIATALLLASVSVTIEQYLKIKLTDPDIISVLAARKLGVVQVQERHVTQGSFTGLPPDVLEGCHHELLIVAYAADSFVTRNRSWLVEALDSGKRVGLLILHPDQLEQPRQTEGRDLRHHIQNTLAICEQILDERPARRDTFAIRGYPGHLYYTGLFVDRYILAGSSVHKGLVGIQLKANYKTQHEGLVLTLAPSSKYAEYYSDSCKAVWDNGLNLLNSAPNTAAS